MKNKKLIYILSAVLVLAFLSLGAYESKESKGTERLAKINNNDDTKYIAINQVLMWIGNNGMGSHDPRTDGSGFYWPGGEQATITAIFADGLIWGAKVGREIRCGGATYNYGLQAGKILDSGLADDPSLDKYRIFRIRKNLGTVTDPDTRAEMQRDADEWPGADGAPYIDVDNDGIFTSGVDLPDYVGDEVLYCVSNDMDAARTTNLYGTNPMGLEVHTLVFGFNQVGDFGDMVFKKYTVINKGQRRLDDMIFGYWSDTDLGFAADDFTGCDVALSLGYTYNGDNYDDDYYNGAPPAVGYDFFQGPIIPGAATDSAKFLDGWRYGYQNLPMTAFTFYINGDEVYQDPDLGSPAGSVQMYNYLSGYVWDGNPFIDPSTGQETNICLSGDPVAGTGWYEGPVGWPNGKPSGDRRHLMASGPFTMAPGDTQEIVVGLLIGRAGSNIESVTELKRVDRAAQIAYDLDFNITPPPPPPTMNYFNTDKKITLWWENNAESYDETDPLIFGLGLDDTTYTFEGYRVWQFPSNTSSLAEATLLGTFDIENGIDEVSQPAQVDDYQYEEVLFGLPNKGITNVFEVVSDEVNGNVLFNGVPYYFGVTAFGYNSNSIPRFLESPPIIYTIYPRKANIDETLSLEVNAINQAALTTGNPDARVEFKAKDPFALQNASYKVEITDDLGWNIQKATSEGYDTLLVETNYGDETDDLNFNRIVDGFVVNVYDDGKDAIENAVTNKSALKSLVEVVNGVEAGNVFGETSANGNWSILSSGYLPPTDGKPPVTDVNTFNVYDKVAEGTYEIRFTGSSEYYLSSMKSVAFNGAGFKGDPKAAGTVPFEIWSLGDDLESTADDVRLVVMVQDEDPIDPDNWTTNDGTWTQLANGTWEAVYGSDPGNDGYPATLEDPSPGYKKKQLVGNIVFNGDLPANGTVLRFNTYKVLQAGDTFEFTVNASEVANQAAAKDNMDGITVYPNPYYATHTLEMNKYNRFVRFLGLPVEATVRIYSLSGVFVRRLEKDTRTDFLDWDLLNRENLPVASGVYLAHIDMPGVGEKILKIAVIMEAQYLDRI